MENRIIINSCPACLKKYDKLYGNTIFISKEFDVIEVEAICKQCFEINLKKQIDMLGITEGEWGYE